MARKSLSERIAERAQRKQKKGRGGANRAAFLAIRCEIAKALDDGWSVKEAWETLAEEGSISFGYDAFLGYVKKLIRPQSAAAGSRQAASKTEQSPSRASTPVASPPPQPKVEPQRVVSAPIDSEPQRVETNHTSSFVYPAKPKKKREP